MGDTKTKLKGSTALAKIAVPDLKVLGDKINDDLARREQSKLAWIDATLDLCRHLAEARAQFKDNASFGSWFKTSGIKMNDHDRAAAVDMGGEPERAKIVLESTERRSLQLIHDKEFRLASASKTTRPAKAKAPLVIDGEAVPTSPEAPAPADANSKATAKDKALQPKTPEPRPVAAEIVPKIAPVPAVGGMLPLADVELHLEGVITLLDRLARREQVPAITSIADQLRELVAGWRGDLADEDIPDSMQKAATDECRNASPALDMRARAKGHRSGASIEGLSELPSLSLAPRTPTSVATSWTPTLTSLILWTGPTPTSTTSCNESARPSSASAASGISSPPKGASAI